MSRRTTYFFFFAATVMMVSAGFSTAATTVLFNDAVVEIENTLAAPNDLWVSPADLTKITGLELKPEGACLDDICVPVKQDTDSELFVTRSSQRWFNVSELARRLNQAYIFDHEAAVWSFGEIPATRSRVVNAGMAPDFELPDRSGKPIKLSAYKDKKVILLTWASW